MAATIEIVRSRLRSAPCHLLGLSRIPSSLPKALLTGVRRSCRCFEISRVKACFLQAARPPPHPPRKLENIFVTPAACEAAQSFEKDGVNGRLLRAGIESRKRASLHIKLWCGAATNPPYPGLALNEERLTRRFHDADHRERMASVFFPSARSG